MLVKVLDQAATRTGFAFEGQPTPCRACRPTKETTPVPSTCDNCNSTYDTPSCATATEESFKGDTVSFRFVLFRFGIEQPSVHPPSHPSVRPFVDPSVTPPPRRFRRYLCPAFDLILLSLDPNPRVPLCPPPPLPLPSPTHTPGYPHPPPTRCCLVVGVCRANYGRYPVILNSFGLRRGSGGGGARRGGDGVSREMTFRKNLTVSVLSERRAFRPWGLAGGLPAERGVRVLP